MLFGASSQKIEYIIAGLGNPGLQYAATRHNVGFMAVDSIAKHYDAKLDKLKHKALTGRCVINGRGVLLLKPQTFMNLSGEAIADVARFYKVPPQNIIVIFDDCSLPIGSHRMRLKGSAGGHNGIKSIISCLGTDAFPRFKVGIGEKPYHDMDLADYVLGNIPLPDSDKIAEGFEDLPPAIELFISGNSEKAMSRYNK